MKISHYDKELSNKLRQIQKELLDWANKAERGKLQKKDIERMKCESNLLQKLIANKEL